MLSCLRFGQCDRKQSVEHVKMTAFYHKKHFGIFFVEVKV